MADLKKRVGTPANGRPAVAKPAEEIPDHPLARCVPRGDRVVVRRDIAKERKHGNIILPDSFDTGKQQTGVVWSVGPGKRDDDGDLIPLDLKKGDRVIITGWTGLEINDPMSAGSKDEEFVLLRDEDVVATLPAR